LTGTVASPFVAGQDPRPDESGTLAIQPMAVSATHFGSSPFTPPEANDATFVVDQGPGLDTGCTFRDGSPLVFTIEVDRVVGDVTKLKAEGMIGETAALRMPAYDVDFDAVVPPYNPERDRVYFNGRLVPSEYLTGANNVWKLNEFNVPIEWVQFPPDPGAGGTVTPEPNEIRIDIDVANTELVWCTAIDWAALSIEVARPVVMVHGILAELSSYVTWNDWTQWLGDTGLPNNGTGLQMGNLDSIQSNAGKIADAVADARSRWGVDKVNLVSHSKGGLDSRHFVEVNDDVEQLIQIGTPNAGSPLADFIQSTAVRLLGPIPTILINVLAGPAGVQLTQPYMAVYNLMHGSNADVRYTALAGDYQCDFFDPDCGLVDWFLLGLTDRGDTIVPVSSVYALGYIPDRRLHVSSGANRQAVHTEQTGSIDIFNQLFDRVSAFGRVATANALALPTTLARTATAIGSVQQGVTATHALPVDQDSVLTVTLLFPSGDLDLALISPSGQRYDRASIAINPAAAIDEADLLGSRLEVITLTNPEVGIWTVEVQGTQVVEPTGSVAYALNGWLQDPAVVLTAKPAQAGVAVGEPIVIHGTLSNAGAPVFDAQLTAQVAAPDDSLTEIHLSDNGLGYDETASDGIYTGAIPNTTLAGTYRLVVEAREGTSGLPAFSREAFAMATVSESAQALAGSYLDTPVDTDGDGLFNELQVEVGLSLTAAGRYRLFAILADSAGHTHEANVLLDLPVGTSTAVLTFDGADIYQNGVDGPYRLSTIRVAEEGPIDLRLVEEARDVYETAAYAFEQFQHAAIQLTGNGTAVGIDTNGNGLYDRLDVRLEVQVDYAGFYNWSARLTTNTGTELGFAARSGFLNAGLNQLYLPYAGEPIGASGIDGPYVVTSLLMYGAGEAMVANQVYTTPLLLASQFEGYVLDTVPPTLNLSLDWSVLWPPNHQMREINATISVVDDTDPNPTVELASIVSSEPDDGLGDGDTPNDIQDAVFGTDDRQFSLRAERSGTGDGRIYAVTYVARDAAGNTATAVATVTVPHDRP
jgi:hypothetical protein